MLPGALSDGNSLTNGFLSIGQPGRKYVIGAAETTDD